MLIEPFVRYAIYNAELNDDIEFVKSDQIEKIGWCAH
jgi:nitric oxide synthase oxygenase domain/subunit